MRKARTTARGKALQAIYQWQMTGEGSAEIERQFVEERETAEGELSFFQDLIHGVPRERQAIDQVLSDFVDRPVESVDPVERAILRLGAYELLYRQDVPYRVVINEWINLSKRFGAEKGHRYVNGILDRVAHKRRQWEVAAQRRQGGPR